MLCRLLSAMLVVDIAFFFCCVLLFTELGYGVTFFVRFQIKFTFRFYFISVFFVVVCVVLFCKTIVETWIDFGSARLKRFVRATDMHFTQHNSNSVTSRASVSFVLLLRVVWLAEFSSFIYSSNGHLVSGVRLVRVVWDPAASEREKKCTTKKKTSIACTHDIWCGAMHGVSRWAQL